MQNFKIYLAGGMCGLSYKEQSEWRNEIFCHLKILETKYDIEVINPVDFYNFETIEYRTTKEPMEFDLFHVRTSQLIIVNFNDPKSIGTAMELMIAKERHIPIIGLNEKKIELHAWLSECCTRICESMSELLYHVDNFYLLGQ